ncbi:Autoinducer 2 sensor kinase/phosphatase LuxQ [Posidoniimonas corsicana]|uniref:histidine kinase n=1 Tax=Posidoniimonas corsicana TaxID=1938618 RepID=A0A5C5UX20_9BACT|nr:PAS domain S-box protein [Posidoniimonas corsicana]TWT30183.1 Autoinducer 2 sensor kinase/phosphatase LuxQ [Posidoniimonas corsicana]
MPQSDSSPPVRTWNLSPKAVSQAVVCAAGGYALAGGAVTVVGWVFDVPKLTNWWGDGNGDGVNDGISMLMNTAVASMACGLALILLTQYRQRWARIIGQGAAWLSILIGGLTLLEHVTGANLGIDTLLANRDWGQDATTSKMRMGPPACISFTIFGVTLLLMIRGRRARRIGSILAVAPLLISSLSLTGYLFNADQLFGIAKVTGIALQSSTILAVLSVGAIAAFPDRGVSSVLSRDDIGGRLFRRMLAPVLIVPPILGWVLVRGADAGYYDAQFNAAMLVLIGVAVFVALLWWTAKNLGNYAIEAQRAHNHLATIVETSHDSIISKSLDGTIVSWNAGAEQLYGYTEAEIVGKTVMLITPEERREEEDQILARLSRGERIQDLETERLHKDGSLVQVSMSVSPVRDESGAIVGASNIARDITQRKRADEMIRRSESDLRTLADTMPELAWMAHPDGDIFWYNRRWNEYTGRSLEEMRGWGWRDVHDPDVLPTVLARWEHSLATGAPFEMEFPLKGADGNFRWFLTRVQALRDDSGRVVRWFGTNTDIDRVKRVEQRLRDQTETLELLNETAKAVGSVLELDDLLQFITDIGRRLSGAKFAAFFYNTKDEHGDALLLYALSGADREEFDSLGMPRATDLFGPTFRGEEIIRSDDITQDERFGRNSPHNGLPTGHLPVKSYLAVPVAIRSGEVIGGLFFGHPEPGRFSEQIEHVVAGIASQAAVSIENARLYDNLKQAADDRLRLLEAERAARSEAERVNVMKDEFLATLSHELRTPLNAILGWAQILDPESSDKDEMAEGLEIIQRNARTQTQLIEDLLDMSRIISGKVRLEPEPINPADVLRQSVESVRHSADMKGVELRQEIDPDPVVVSGDPTRLQQVFWNLLSNAIKFTPEGGRVTMSLRRDGGHVEVAVSDSGIGVKPEFLAVMFDRFRQADSSTTRAYGGLGLGLSIVKNLVELHGGSIEAASGGEGQGATFTVRLPLKRSLNSGQRSRDDKQANGHSGLDGLKVLIVEDEIDSRALLQRILGQADARVAAAGSADEGMSLLRSTRPDVIISDIGMPGVDGYQFMRNVRELPESEGGQTPAVALTALSRSEDRMQAMMAGYQSHIAKPVDPERLINTLHGLMATARSGNLR